MSNGTDEQQDLILSYPNLLSALQVCLSEAKAEVRGPAVSCILELVTRNPRRKKAMTEAGIVGTLKRLCEWSGHGHHGGTPTTAAASSGVGWGGGSTTTTATFISSNTGGGGGAAAGGGRSPAGRRSGAPPPPPTPTPPGSWGGSSSVRHNMHGSSGHSIVGFDEDRAVVQRARVALDWLEHGEGYV